MFDRAMGAALDRHITGNYGEDQFREVDLEEFLEYTCSRCFMQSLGLVCPAYERYFVDGYDNLDEMENCLVVKAEIEQIEADQRAEDESQYELCLEMQREEEAERCEVLAHKLAQECTR